MLLTARRSRSKALAQSGWALLMDKELRDSTLDDWRTRIALVAQDTYLFNWKIAVGPRGLFADRGYRRHWRFLYGSEREYTRVTTF